MRALLASLVVGVALCAPPATFKLGGLFPRFKLSNSLDGSGVQRLAAFMLAVEEINNSTTILPSTQIAVYVRDSKRDSGTAFFEALTLAQTNGVSAIVGPASSGPCASAALVTTKFKLPQISYSGTSPALSNAISYTHFMRTPPSDAFQSIAMASMMKRTFGWQNVVTVATADAYGSAGMAAFLRAASAEGINVLASVTYNEGTTNYLPNINLIKERAGASGVAPRLIVIFAQVETAGEFIKAGWDSGLITDATTIWGSDALKNADLWTKTAGLEARHLKGMFSMSASNGKGTPRYTGFAANYKRFTQGSTAGNGAGACHPATDAAGNFLWQGDHDLNAATANECAGVDFPAQTEDSLNSYAPYAYDATWAIARAADSLFKAGKSTITGDELKAALLDLSMEGVSGLVEFSKGNATKDYEGQGDRETGAKYDVFNHDATAFQRVGYFEYRATASAAFNATAHKEWHPEIAASYHFWPCDRWNSTSPNRCPVLGGSSDPVTFAGKQSPAINHKPKDLEGIIVTCAAGTYCPTELKYLKTCYPCPTGSYMSYNNTRPACDKCPLTEYADAKGSTSCKVCPENTKALFIGSKAVTLCLCKEGFYHSSAQAGLACIKCPFGGKCLGGTALPYPSPGYWTVKTSNRTDMWECGTPDACPGWVKGKTEAANMVDAFECGTGYGDNVCNSCTNGYFKFTANCINCVSAFTSNFRAVYVIVLLCMIGLWVALNKLVAAQLDAIDVSLLFMQILDMVGKFNLNWNNASLAVFGGLTFVNFNVDLVSPQCITSYTFKDAWVLNMMMPFFAITLLSLNWSFTWASAKFADRFCKKKEKKKDVDAKALWMTMKSKVAKKSPIDITGVLNASSSAWDRWKTSATFTFTSFLNIVYPSLAYTSFLPFRCQDLAGTSVLIADPTIECNTSAHQSLVMGAVFGIIVYVIGIPVFFINILYNGRKHRLFDQQSYRDQYGWLFMRFESEYYFWELTFQARRLAFVLISIFVADGIVQGVMGLFFIAAGTMMHFYARPFAETALDYLESTALGLLFALLASGMFFNARALDAGMGNALAGYEKFFNGFVYLLFLVGLVQIVHTSYHNISRLLHRRKIHHQVGMKCSERTWAHVLALCESFEEIALSRWMSDPETRVKDFEFIAHSMSHINRISSGLDEHEIEVHEQRKMFYRHLAKSVPEVGVACLCAALRAFACPLPHLPPCSPHTPHTPPCPPAHSAPKLIDYLVLVKYKERTECANALQHVEEFYVKSQMARHTAVSGCYAKLFDEESYQNVVQWMVHHAGDEREMFLFHKIMMSMLPPEAKAAMQPASAKKMMGSMAGGAMKGMGAMAGGLQQGLKGSFKLTKKLGGAILPSGTKGGALRAPTNPTANA